MDRNNRIGRRERREILKSTQGLGEGVVADDKGPPIFQATERQTSFEVTYGRARWLGTWRP